MSTNPPPAERARASGLRGHVAGIVALAALAAVCVALYKITRQPPQLQTELGLNQSVVVIGAGAFLTALLAEIRAMSFMDVLELLGDLIAGMFGAIWAVLKGIGNFILGLFGWD